MSADSIPITAEPQELPFALVQGRAVFAPHDLYIPPDALEVFLEAFEGPLDLLLYLIKRNNIDILDIPISEITRQYMQYIELMKDLRLELAAEYLVMAAMLAEIKSRMLLPRPSETVEEADPRAELIRRLQEYERFKRAAETLDQLPRVERDVFPAVVAVPETTVVRLPPRVELRDIVHAIQEVMARAEAYSHHQVLLEPLSVRERMSNILQAVGREEFTGFASLLTVEEGRRGVVVTLLALLELVRESLIELVQTEVFGPIYIRAAQDANRSSAH
jgi:segregation and condensation protein A